MADSAPQFGIQEIDQRLGIHPLEILAVDGEIRAGFALADAASPGEGAVDRMLLEIFFDDFQIPLVAPGETGAAHADDDGVFHSFSSYNSFVSLIINSNHIFKNFAAYLLIIVLCINISK